MKIIPNKEICKKCYKKQYGNLKEFEIDWNNYLKGDFCCPQFLGWSIILKPSPSKAEAESYDQEHLKRHCEYQLELIINGD